LTLDLDHLESGFLVELKIGAQLRSEMLLQDEKSEMLLRVQKDKKVEKQNIAKLSTYIGEKG
jgi:uncharacterized protein YwgA